MRCQRPILLPRFLVASIVLAVLLFYSASPVTSHARNKNLNANIERPNWVALTSFAIEWSHSKQAEPP